MENKLISVIIPIYNVEEYLERSVNSVINQSYKNLEIILVDDGSTDKSGSICDKYASLDSRVKVIHKINGGQASAINVALDSAKGEYIGFSDPDDYINKDFYKNLYLVYLEEFDIADKDIELFDDVGGLRKLFGDDFAEYLETIVKVNKIYKRYLFDTIRFSEVRIYEEWGTMYKLYCNTKRNLKLHKVQYVYVQRKNSTLGRPFSMERLLMLDGIEYCKDLAKEKDLNDLVLDCYRKYFETIIRFISMIEAPNTIDREGLRKRLIKIFTEKYEDYRQVFDKLYTNYEKALNKENGIE